jgi:hypothetical protein
VTGASHHNRRWLETIFTTSATVSYDGFDMV